MEKAQEAQGVKCETIYLKITIYTYDYFCIKQGIMKKESRKLLNSAIWSPTLLLINVDV